MDFWMVYPVLIVLAVIGRLGIEFGPKLIEARKRKELPAVVHYKFATEKAKEIYSEWWNLPTERRPSYDIGAILTALEVKHNDHGPVDAHFGLSSSYYYSPAPSPHNSCAELDRYHECPYEDFSSIHRTIDAITEELEREERIVEMARVQGSLSEHEQLVEALRNEHTLIKEANDYVEGAL